VDALSLWQLRSDNQPARLINCTIDQHHSPLHLSTYLAFIHIIQYLVAIAITTVDQSNIKMAEETSKNETATDIPQIAAPADSTANGLPADQPKDVVMSDAPVDPVCAFRHDYPDR
jgi:hypothetical protein